MADQATFVEPTRTNKQRAESGDRVIRAYLEDNKAYLEFNEVEPKDYLGMVAVRFAALG
jgi:hypothetical protein